MDRYELRRLDYSLSEDHQAIQEAYQQFFKTHCSIETVRAAEESGFDKSLWERLCAMGATTMALPGIGRRGRGDAGRPDAGGRGDRPLAGTGAVDRPRLRRPAAGAAGRAGRPTWSTASSWPPSTLQHDSVSGRSADSDGLDRRPDRRPRRRRRRAPDVRHPPGQRGQHRQAADGVGGSRRRRQPHRGRERRRCARGIPTGAG